MAMSQTPDVSPNSVLFRPVEHTEPWCCCCSETDLNPFRLIALSKAWRDMSMNARLMHTHQVLNGYRVPKQHVLVRVQLSEHQWHMMRGREDSWLLRTIRRWREGDYDCCSRQVVGITLAIDTYSWQVMCSQLFRTLQEKTGHDAIAANPYLTRTCAASRVEAGEFSQHEYPAYECVIAFVAAKYATGEVCLVGHVGDDCKTNVTETDSELIVTHDEGLPILRTRCAHLGTPDLRPSMVITPHEGDVPVPQDDEVAGVFVAPAIATVTPSLGLNPVNELSGILRHAAVVRDADGVEITRGPNSNADLDYVTDLLTEVMCKCARENIGFIDDLVLPRAWSTEQTDACLEAAADPDRIISRLDGFVKRGELGLPLDKRARLIGNPGPVEAAAQAEWHTPFEWVFKHSLKHFVVKGLTLDQIDNTMANFCSAAKDKPGCRLRSIDFSKMDSTWRLEDRERTRRLVVAVATAAYDRLAGHEMRDPTDAERVTLTLKYFKLSMDRTVAWLFSGERGTSMAFNRTAVITIHAANIYRLVLDGTAPDAFIECVPGARRADEPLEEYARRCVMSFFTGEWENSSIGDGDDDASLMPSALYRDNADMKTKFAIHGRVIEPASSDDETQDMEVLSRYHIWVGGKTSSYVHINKVQRSVQRAIVVSLPSTATVDLEKGCVYPNHAEFAEMATAVMQRGFSMTQTMGVRWLYIAVSKFLITCAGDNATTIYGKDGARRGLCDGDRRLIEMLADLESEMSAAETSCYAMVRATNFGLRLSQREIASLKKMWRDVDELWRGMEYTADDVRNPNEFIGRYLPTGPGKAALIATLGLNHKASDVLTPWSAALTCDPSPPPGLGNAASPNGGGERKRTTASSSGAATSGEVPELRRTDADSVIDPELRRLIRHANSTAATGGESGRSTAPQADGANNTVAGGYGRAAQKGKGRRGTPLGKGKGRGKARGGKGERRGKGTEPAPSTQDVTGASRPVGTLATAQMPQRLSLEQALPTVPGAR